MQYKVCKFGGSSVANAEKISSVVDIVTSDQDRKYVVVSAPGKAGKNEDKITDHLINCATYGAHLRGKGISQDGSLAFIRDRFGSICQDLGVDSKLPDAFMYILESRLKRDYPSQPMKEDAIKAWGEDSNAKVIAEFMKKRGINAEYVNPKDIGFLVDERYGDSSLLPQSYAKVSEGLSGKDGIVVFPGFFGYTSAGDIATFSRGGSDLTGAILASALQAREYENFTDVDGILMADPNIVRMPRLIRNMTYAELRELSYMGFNVFHDEAVAPVRRAMVPTHLRNTNHPERIGTHILNTRIPEDGEIITGVACKKGFASIDILKEGMNRERGFLARATGIVADEGVSIDHITTGVDFTSIIFHRSEVDDLSFDRLLKRMYEGLGINRATDSIDVQYNRAMVITVGEGMRHTPGVAARITGACAKSRINIQTISQPEHELSVTLGVKDTDAEKAVRAICKEFNRNR